MNNRKGISLIMLIITIVLALILVMSTAAVVGNAINNSRITTFASDVLEVQDALKSYYIQNDVIPVLGDEKVYSQFEIEDFLENAKQIALFEEELSLNGDFNDNRNLGAFYILDIGALGVEQTARGLQEQENDVYVASYPSMNVYYLKGLSTRKTTYFSMSPRLSSLIKNFNKKTEEISTEITTQTVDGITVKKLKKKWTNILGMTIETNIANADESLYLSVQGGNEVLLPTKVGQNILKLNSLTKVFSSDGTETNLNTDLSKYDTANQNDKYIEIIKKQSGNVVGKIAVSISNYEIELPTLKSDIKLHPSEEYNLATFYVGDNISGIKEVRYEYLTKFDIQGFPQQYYTGVTEYESSYIKARGKKATVSEDGYVEIKIPKEIEGIEVRIFDNASNASERITIGNKRDIYVGANPKSLSTTKAIFDFVFNSTSKITDAIAYISNNGVDFINGTKLFVPEPTSSVAIVENISFNNLTNINDTIYVKITATDENKNTETRVQKFNIFDVNDSEQINSVIPGVPVDKDTPYTTTNSNGGKDTAIIPEGFKVSEIKNEQTIETGLVVIAPDDSEFVWVPVPENELNLFAEQDGTSDESGNPNMRGKLWEFTKDGPNTGTEIPYSSTGYREPDIVTGYDNDTNNLNTINTILGISLKNATDLKNLMQKEYNEIYNSVKEYHGFYIGRYETGDLSKDKVVSKKGNEDIGNQTWYTMYAKEKKYATQLTGTKIKSNMIYGSQWDATMRWFAKSSNNFVKTYPVNAQNSINANYSGSQKPTGSVGSVNNIYDMAGNMHDWVVGALAHYGRVLRGWGYNDSTDYSNAGSYTYNVPSFSYNDCTSRLSLYIPASSSVTEKTYVKNGLILHLDGINNTGSSHSNTSTIWKDLSGNNNDGTIKGASWINNGLAFDGVNDWVPIKELNYPEFTAEVTFSVNKLDGSENGIRIICNHQTGGFDIEINNNNIACFPYINGEYKSMRDNSEIIINKKYNATITTNGVESKLYVNGTLISSISVKDGVIGYPLNNTVVTLGANPKGTSAEAQFFNGTIYSARMYNRVLTKQEIKNNYEIDKSRFGM